SPEDDPGCGGCKAVCNTENDCCTGAACITGRCWHHMCGLRSQSDAPRTSKLENLFKRFLEKALKEKHDDTPR
ncbi:Hypothetical predicted protein, partial [Paramuricea clavata]